jgi:hypothetical protein
LNERNINNTTTQLDPVLQNNSSSKISLPQSEFNQDGKAEIEESKTPADKGTMNDWSKKKIVDHTISELFFKSRCTTDPKEKTYLQKLLNNKKLVTTLVYSSFRDGWTKDDFWRLCEGKTNTVSLMKVSGGPCIGGYMQA